MVKKIDLSKPPDPTEDEIQCAFVERCRLNRKHHPELRMLYATPNGGKRSMSEAMRLKAAGVEAGIPDMSLDVARQGYHGLKLEFKRGNKGRVDEDQKRWHEELIIEGYFVAVVRSVEEAMLATAWYLQKEKDDLFRDRPMFDRWNGAG